MCVYVFVFCVTHGNSRWGFEKRETAKSSEGRVDSGERNRMSVEKITRWAEQTAVRQCRGLKAMTVIWTQEEL